MLRASLPLQANSVPFSTFTNFEVLIDRTSIEIFADDRAACMSKCFLLIESGISLGATGGRAIIKNLKLVWLNPNSEVAMAEGWVGTARCAVTARVQRVE